MYNIALFGEDSGHEAFISAVVERLINKRQINAKLNNVSVRGGRGRAVSELNQYLRDRRVYEGDLPDIIIVAIDSNCDDVADKIREIRRGISKHESVFRELVVYAIPDPHIERWMLIDSEAFKKVFGPGVAHLTTSATRIDLNICLRKR